VAAHHVRSLTARLLLFSVALQFLQRASRALPLSSLLVLIAPRTFLELSSGFPRPWLWPELSAPTSPLRSNPLALRSVVVRAWKFYPANWLVMKTAWSRHCLATTPCRPLWISVDREVAGKCLLRTATERPSLAPFTTYGRASCRCAEFLLPTYSLHRHPISAGGCPSYRREARASAPAATL
jgi:hypothetical protein